MSSELTNMISLPVLVLGLLLVATVFTLAITVLVYRQRIRKLERRSSLESGLSRRKTQSSMENRATHTSTKGKNQSQSLAPHDSEMTNSKRKSSRPPPQRNEMQGKSPDQNPREKKQRKSKKQQKTGPVRYFGFDGEGEGGALQETSETKPPLKQMGKPLPLVINTNISNTSSSSDAADQVAMERQRIPRKPTARRSRPPSRSQKPLGKSKARRSSRDRRSSSKGHQEIPHSRIFQAVQSPAYSAAVARLAVPLSPLSPRKMSHQPTILEKFPARMKRRSSYQEPPSPSICESMGPMAASDPIYAKREAFELKIKKTFQAPRTFGPRSMHQESVVFKAPIDYNATLPRLSPRPASKDFDSSDVSSWGADTSGFHHELSDWKMSADTSYEMYSDGDSVNYEDKCSPPVSIEPLDKFDWE
jgi:hypothetical protein